MRWILPATIAILCAFPALSQNEANSVSAYVSGVGVDNSAEWHPDGRVRNVRSSVGAVAVGFERRVSSRTSLELSAEYRRDIATAFLSYRCGPYQNTCFLQHRFAITSTPVVFLARYTAPVADRLAVFGSAGLRYVAKPDAKDVTTASLYSFETTTRSNPEVGGGFAFRAVGRLWLFADGRMLLTSGTEWDPRRRLNAGIRIRY